MVRAETYQMYREAIIGEFTRAKYREGYLREVINWIAGHLGQEFDSRGIAADTDIGSKDTARHYVEHLAETYVVDIAYRTNSLDHPAPAFRAPKKVHAIDPLVFHLIRSWAGGDPDPWVMASGMLQRPDEVGWHADGRVYAIPTAELLACIHAPALGPAPQSLPIASGTSSA